MEKYHGSVVVGLLLDCIRSMREPGHVARRCDAKDGRAFEARLTTAGLRAFHRTNVAWNEALLDFEPALGMPVQGVRRALHAIDDAAARTLRGLVQRSISRAG